MENKLVKFTDRYDMAWYIDNPALPKPKSFIDVFQNFIVHHPSQPALCVSCCDVWYNYGKVHRVGGPARFGPDIEEWCINGQYHREDGPAIISKERTMWFIHNREHRLNGPSYETKSGTYSRWSIFGNIVDSAEYLNWCDEMNIDINNISENDLILIKMRWDK